MSRAATWAARWGAGLVTAASLVTLTACASTTYDTSIPSDPPAATTTTLPTGDAATLLPRLVKAAGSLSAQITGTDGDKTAVADQIVSLWDASKQEVGKNRPELLGDFEANVTRCTNAARFNRAADADKAYKNLDALVSAYLAPAA